MKRIAALAAVALGSTSAEAAQYYIQITSTMDDVRRIGGRSIPELSQYSGYGGSLNVQDPSLWPLLDKDITTFPTYSGGVATGGIELNSLNVSGLIEVVGGVVTSATIIQAGPLSVGMFQSAIAFGGSSDTWNNMVTGDPSLQVGATQGTPGTTPLNPLTWVLGSNALGQTLAHQGGGGTLATSNNTTTCVVIGPSGNTAGQCTQLAGSVNGNGVFGGNVSNSVWNFTGVAANYNVSDTANTPWATASGTAQVNVGGASGLAGVVWDLSGFNMLTGGVITARTAADALASAGTGGGSGSAISARFVLNLVPIPVPAAVWMLGSAVGLLGLLRRRSRRV